MSKILPCCSTIIHALKMGDIWPSVSRAITRKTNPASTPLIFSIIVATISLSVILGYLSGRSLLHSWIQSNGGPFPDLHMTILQACYCLLSDLEKGLRDRSVGQADDDRVTLITAHDGCRVQRDTSQQGLLVELDSGLLTRRKNSHMLTTVRTQKTIHVLHNAEHRHMSLLEHRQSFCSINPRDILRGSYQNGPINMYLTTEGCLRLAGSGRKIYQ